MLIPSKYEIEDGKEAPAGSVVLTCDTCKKRFAIPTEEAAKEYSLMKSYACEKCGEIADKIAKVESETEMKVSDAADTVKTALGE